jgi:hypothetical protein
MLAFERRLLYFSVFRMCRDDVSLWQKILHGGYVLVLLLHMY